MLLDEGSFIELDAFVTHRTTDHNMHLHPSAGDGVVAVTAALTAAASTALRRTSACTAEAWAKCMR